MSKGNNKHSTIGKNFEIDQAAVKIFDGWLPNNWLSRKQTPDVFVDYLVELVENGEPTGLHFAAQISQLTCRKAALLPAANVAENGGLFSTRL